MTDHNDIRERYLDMMKQCLTRSFLEDHERFDRVTPPVETTLYKRIRYSAYGRINRILARSNLVLVQNARPTGETMVSMERLDNLHECIRNVLEEKIPGDLIETGVWRGGSAIFMKAVLEAYGDKDRIVWAADSFQGLPKPDEEKYPEDKGSAFWSQSLAVSVDQVKRNFEKYGLLDDRVRFIVGFFSDTMPSAPVDKLAILRLDGDMYESTIVVLENLYSKLSPGGYAIIDDYGCVPACRKAVETFRKARGIDDPIETIDWTGAYWRKSE